MRFVRNLGSGSVQNPKNWKNIYIYSYFIIIMHNKIEIMRKYKYFPVLGVLDHPGT